MSCEQIHLVITDKQNLTEDICRFELSSPDGGELPPFEAGAHITVQTPSGVKRSYSLNNDEVERNRYVIAVKREDHGRGGSLSMHRETRVGDRIAVSAPSNALPLVRADRYLLIAGGIGITPMLSMLQKLQREGNENYHLVYCTRSPETTAYRELLNSPCFKGKVTINHDFGDPSKSYNFWPHLEMPHETHLYYCGPPGLMNALYRLSIHWPRRLVHYESFSGVSAVDGTAFPFVVRQASSGQQFKIPAERTILDVLREAGFQPASSCESGTCGTCRMPLMSGEVDHRDLVLTDSEKQSFIMPCVSRAAGEEIVLDF